MYPWEPMACRPFPVSPSPSDGSRLQVPTLNLRSLFSALPEAANPWRAAPAGFSGPRSTALCSTAPFVPALGTLQARDFPVQSFIITSENSHYILRILAHWLPPGLETPANLALKAFPKDSFVYSILPSPPPLMVHWACLQAVLQSKSHVRSFILCSLP